MGEMHTLHPDHGDLRLAWKAGVRVEEEVAESNYAKLVQEGYVAFRMTPDGLQGTKMLSFDPAVEKIIFVRPSRGG